MSTDERESRLAKAQKFYDRARELFADARECPEDADVLHAAGVLIEQRGAAYWAAAFPSRRRASA